MGDFQTMLFDPERVIDPKSRFGRFLNFHRKNPGIWELFERFAIEALLAGRERFGGRMIGERIRWYTRVETTDCEYKINDHFWPYYVRLLMLKDKRFESVFERRDAHFDVDDETLLREAGCDS